MNSVTVLRSHFPSRWMLGLALGLSLFLSPASAAAIDSPAAHGGESHFVYELLSPQIQEDDAYRLATLWDLTPIAPLPHGTEPLRFSDSSGRLRMIYERGRLSALPDLERLASPGPSQDWGIAHASEWLRLNVSQMPGQPEFAVGEVLTVSARHPQPDGSYGEPVPVLHTIQFRRELDGLPLVGPGSVLTLDVGAAGVVGAIASLRPLSLNPRKVETISEIEAIDRFWNEFPAAATVHEIELIYVEQGKRFVQPAYRFNIAYVTRDGRRGNTTWLVAATRQILEPLDNAPLS